MADQVVTGAPGNEGVNPSGVGAVIFDQGPDLMTQHLNNLKNYDEGMKQRQAQHQQKLSLGWKMLSDLDPNVNGIMDSDQQYFQQRGAGLQQFQADMLKSGLDPNNPMYMDAYTKGNNLSKSMEIDVNASKAQKEMLFKYMQEASAHPEKYDLDATNKNIASFRSTPFDLRRSYDIGKILVPKKSDLLTLSKTNVLKDVPLDIASETIKEPVSGGFQTVQTKTYTPQHIQGLAQAGYLGNGDVTEAVNIDYDKVVDPNKKLSYQQQAEAESKAAGRTVAPQEVWYREYLKGISPNEQTRSGIAFSPMQHAWAQNAFADQDEEESVKYVAEALKNAKGDDPQFWETEVTEGGPNMVTGTLKNTFGFGEPVSTTTKYTQALNNLPLGKAMIPMPARDNTTGEIIYKEGTKDPVIAKYEPVDNRVLNMKKENGKVYIQTDESMAKQLQGSGTGWEEVTDRTIDKMVLGSKNPIKAAATLRKTLSNMGWYGNTQVNLGGDKPKEKLTW